jgi:8-oxo-dGTP pyrophosphatase MutT (NUDIX family)
MAGARLSDEDRRRAAEGIQSARDALVRGGGPVPADEFYKRLPHHVAGANVVFRDEAERVLLVQPVYRTERWQIPGGWMDPDEYPFDTARREIHEELGLTVDPAAPLIAVDWVPATGARPPAAVYVFDGGRLAEDQAQQSIRLQVEELAAWRFASADQWAGLLTAPSARRLHSAVDALHTGTTAYLHHGHPRHL